MNEEARRRPVAAFPLPVLLGLHGVEPHEVEAVHQHLAGQVLPQDLADPYKDPLGRRFFEDGLGQEPETSATMYGIRRREFRSNLQPLLPRGGPDGVQLFIPTHVGIERRVRSIPASLLLWIRLRGGGC